MNKKNLGFMLTALFLLLPGCAGSVTKSYMREGASLAYIQTIAVLPFEGSSRAPRIREFAMTQVLASKMFDVVDKGRVDGFLQEEAISTVDRIDAATIRRMGQRLQVQAFIFGSVEQESQQRGNANFSEITMTMRLIDSETGAILWAASGRGSGYSLADRLFGMAPRDHFQVTMKLLNDMFATMR
jgi:TolB-like protein